MSVGGEGDRRSRRVLLCRSGLAAFWFLGCGQAIAQAPSSLPARDNAVSLEAITVTGQSDTGYVARDATTATKTDTPLIKTPQSISVVTRDQMDARDVQSITDALRYSAGVFTSTSAVSQRFDNFSIRGFDATNTGLVRDGLRGTTGQAWPKAEPYGLERVEILRGPSSVLYGQNSPGGLVNQITKRPLDRPLREVEVQAGTFNRFQGQADFSGPIDADGKFLYRLTALARDSDTQFYGVPDDKIFVAPAFTWRPDTATSLTVLGDFNYDRFGPPRPFLPIQGTILFNPNGPLPQDQFLDEPSLDNNRKQVSVGYLFDHQFDDVWKVRSSFRYGSVDLLTNTASGISLAANLRTLNRTLYQFRIIGDTYSTDNNVQADWTIGAARFTSLVGVDYRHTTEDYSLKSGSASPIDIYNPVYGRPYGPLTTTNASTWQISDQVGGYAQQQIEIDKRLILSFAGRYDWSNAATQNRLTNATTWQYDKAFTYRAGLLYLTEVGLAPYVSYSTSFLPILGVDFYGQPYKPTTSRQIEIGLKYQPPGSASFVTAAVFDLLQNNVQTVDPSNPLNRLQTGQVRSRGVELEAVATLWSGFNLIASYTYTDLQVTSSNNPMEIGKSPTGVPAHMASVWGDYTIEEGRLAGLGFGAGVRYVGPSFADTANTVTVPSYTLMDAMIRYDFDALGPHFQGLRLAVNATNLTNAQYYSTCSATSCNAGYDRTIIARLRYRW